MAGAQSLFIQDKETLLRELKTGEPGEPELPDRIDVWDNEGYRMSLGEIYEENGERISNPAARKLLEIFLWSWLADAPRVLGIPESDADELEIDFMLTPDELEIHCKDFETIEPASVAREVFEPGGYFPDEDTLAKYIQFWRDHFLEARESKKTLAFVLWEI